MTLSELSEEKFTPLPRGQARAEWAQFVDYNATLGGNVSVKRCKTFTIFVFSNVGRLALGGMSKNSTVEDIRLAASARMGVSVRGI